MSTVEVCIASWSGTAKYLPETAASLQAQTRKADVFNIAESEERAMHKWNKALAGTTCDYLALPHADDVYEPTFLTEMIAYLDAHPEAVAVFCMDYLIDKDGNRIGQTDLPAGFPRKALYDFEDIFRWTLKAGNVLRCETVVLRVSAARGLEWRDVCGTANDTVFFFELLNRGPIGVLDKRLVRYRQHPESDTERNVRGTAKQWDGLDALLFAARLRPDAVDWRSRVALGASRVRRGAALVEAALKEQQKTSKKCIFCVVHEPPDNAGTGVLAAELVRRGNGLVGGPFVWYVFPSPDAYIPVETVINGVPCIVCQPDRFKAVFDKYRPVEIEFHHLLRWPLDILAAPVENKSLYLHDSYLWCAAFHSFDGEKVCNEPEPEKCAKCSGVPAEQIVTKRKMILERIKGMKIYGNSDYTCHYGALNLGQPVKLFTPQIPNLTPRTWRKRVGYFGNFYPVKGVDVLLEAAAKMHDVQFLFFCDKPHEAMFDGRRLIGYENVLFVGRYKREELPHLVGLIDVVCVPSINESYGLVAREVRMLGVPVVATRTGGLDGTVEPGNVDALVEALA